MIIESFPIQPNALGSFVLGQNQLGGTPNNGKIQSIIPSYLYQQYADDSDLQAFVNAYNTLAQGYLDWFNQTPLALYTSTAISGSLLDWTASGVYGIERPVLATSSVTKVGGWDAKAWNSIEWNGFRVTQSGTAAIANDDIYKRALTWALYRGDGKQMTVQWLKRRVARFIYGANGSDIDIGLISNVHITNSAKAITITVPTSASGSSALQNLIAQNFLALPFQLTYTVTLA